LESYIDFLEQYCKVVFDILQQSFIRLEPTHAFRQIENVIDVFNKKILAFEIQDYTISSTLSIGGNPKKVARSGL
jgi:hypothetical protein